MGNGSIANVEVVGVFRFSSKNDVVLELCETHVVLSCRRNLISKFFWTKKAILAFLEIDNVVSIIVYKFFI